MNSLLPRFVLAIGLGGLIATGVYAQTPPEVDAASGFITAPGWELVQTTCTVCHSAQIITQNSGNREVWKSRIVWMQETQGLQQLAPDVEASILDYLETNYGPKAASRRAGLAASLLPPNPYSP